MLIGREWVQKGCSAASETFIVFRRELQSDAGSRGPSTTVISLDARRPGLLCCVLRIVAMYMLSISVGYTCSESHVSPIILCSWIIDRIKLNTVSQFCWQISKFSTDVLVYCLLDWHDPSKSATASWSNDTKWLEESGNLGKMKMMIGIFTMVVSFWAAECQLSLYAHETKQMDYVRFCHSQTVSPCAVFCTCWPIFACRHLIE